VHLRPEEAKVGAEEVDDVLQVEPAVGQRDVPGVGQSVR
jgi:hypothetical protein